jgi:branched-chain amino acid transport system permease protein
MVYVLIWVIVGGTATFYGPIIGVTVLSVVNEWFRAFEIWRPFIYGCILIASIMFLPDGLESLPAKLRSGFNRLRGKKEINA